MLSYNRWVREWLALTLFVSSFVFLTTQGREIPLGQDLAHDIELSIFKELLGLLNCRSTMPKPQKDQNQKSFEI